MSIQVVTRAPFEPLGGLVQVDGDEGHEVLVAPRLDDRCLESEGREQLTLAPRWPRDRPASIWRQHITADDAVRALICARRADCMAVNHSRGDSLPEAPLFRTLSIDLRPARMAVLVPFETPLHESARVNWLDYALRAIESQSSVWGGSHNVFVPVSNDGCPAAFWPVLRSLDPDWISYYQPSGRDWELADPETFVKWFDNHCRRWVAENGGELKDAAPLLRDFLDHQADIWSALAVHDLINGETDCARLIRQHLAPLMERGHVLTPGPFFADGLPSHYLTQLDTWPTFNDQFATLSLPAGLDRRLRLMLQSRTGALSSAYKSVLEDRHVRVVEERPRRSDQETLLAIAWFGDLDTARALNPLLSRDHSPLVWTKQWFLEQTPYGRTRKQCGVFRRLEASGSRPFIFVVGESASDFCYAYALDRLFGSAVWMPVRSARSRRSKFDDVLIRHCAIVARSHMHDQTKREVTFTSLSLSPDALEAIRDEVVESQRCLGLPDEPQLTVTQADELRLDEWECARVLMVDHYSRPDTQPFDDGVMPGGLDTPIPDQVDDLSTDPVWHVDARIVGESFPARTAVGKLLFNRRPIVWGRSSQKGPSYYSESPGFIARGEPLRTRLTRPRLRLPMAASLFDALAGDEFDFVLSDKGHYSAQTLRLWNGDIDALVADLRRPGQFQLLRALSQQEGERIDGEYRLPMDGYFEDEAVKGKIRRPIGGFFHLDALAEKSGLDRDDLLPMVDNLTERGVLERGVILQCPDCGLVAWYEAGDFGQYFQCQRCRNRSRVLRSTWRERDATDPTWFVGLREVVRQFISKNSWLTMLAIAELKASAHDFSYAVESGLQRPGKTKPDEEVDLWVVSDSRIIIGEGKSVARDADQPRLGKGDTAKLAHAARVVGADEFVLFTNGEDWPEPAISRLQKALRGGSPLPTQVRAVSRLRL